MIAFRRRESDSVITDARPDRRSTKHNPIQSVRMLPDPWPACALDALSVCSKRGAFTRNRAMEALFFNVRLLEAI